VSAARIALVTGANRGIGCEIARQLRAGGVKVIAGAREPGAGDVTLDITRKDQISAVAERLSDGFDILVNNAAVALDRFDAEVARTRDATIRRDSDAGQLQTTALSP
jgi:NAD(P)-dependent dehydrogenase (short-subunit alcohol dehydrogenase family)